MWYKTNGPLICLALFLFNACVPDDSDLTPVPVFDTELSGGENFTTYVNGENAFGIQGNALTTDESRFFVSGNSLFRSNWVIAPASVSSLDGIGPLFNAISCGSCHFKDGRAAPKGTTAIDRPGLLFRLSIDGETTNGDPMSHPVYGAQLQDGSNPGILHEAIVDIEYEEIIDAFLDGSEYVLQAPNYIFSDLGFGPIDASVYRSPRIAPQLAGLGLLEAIKEDDILALEDMGDADNDGISGKANYVYEEITDSQVLGRFGWKAGQPSILQQNAAAFNGDMGLTSTIYPQDDFTDYQIDQYPDLLDGGSPEVSDQQLDRVTTYVSALSVPARRNVQSPLYNKGKELFEQISCSSCHHPSYTTGSGNKIASLDNQLIYPYTDMLLHDMGPGLADNRSEFLADGQEWRTPPLWGIGMIRVVNGHTQLLHDGRAGSIEEAILWHGGEAQLSKIGYTELTKEERDALLFFVESL